MNFLGVRAIMILENLVLLIGAGNGTINMVRETHDFVNTGNLKLPTTPNLIVVCICFRARPQ